MKHFIVFSRSERNGVILLLSIIFLLFLIRLTFTFITKKPSPLNDETIFISLNEIDQKNYISYKEIKSNKQNNIKEGNLFSFDPNSISYEELILLGINKTVRKALMNFRKKGGKFKVKEDMLKLYGIDSATYIKLKPFIIIISEQKTQYQPETYELIIELNTTDTTELKKLKGIGKVLSNRIIKYRNMLGGFYSPYQLKEVYGINDSLLNLFIHNIKVDTLYIKKIDLNTADYNTMVAHPYITNYTARSILKYRELKDGFNTISDLQYCLSADDKSYNRLKRYFKIVDNY